MKKRLSRLLLIAPLLLCSCVLQGSPLEPDDIPRDKIASAVLRTPSAVLREGEYRDESDFLRIVSIDGEAPRTLDNRVVVPPGSHEVQLSIELRRPNEENPELVDVTRSDTSLKFKAKPAGEYLVDARLDDLGLWVWIVEEFDGDIVAGRHPSGARNIKESEEELE